MPPFPATVLITGANRGLGLELVKKLLQSEGRHVIATARHWNDTSTLSELSLKHKSKITLMPLEITDPSSRSAVIQQLQSIVGIGRLEALINNAGIYPSEWESSIHQKTILTNTIAPTSFAREIRPLMMKGGGGGGGGTGSCIVNASSGLGKLHHLSPLYKSKILESNTIEDVMKNASMFVENDPMGKTSVPSYKISKAAVNRCTELLAREFAADGIRVNCVSPGWCRTDMGGKDAPRSASEGADAILSAVEFHGSGLLINEDHKPTSF